MRADPRQLADLVDQLARCVAQLEAVAADVEARTERLHVTWRGEAATRQVAAHRRWTTGARQTRHALTTLRTIADGAGSNYDAAAAANRGMWPGAG